MQTDSRIQTLVLPNRKYFYSTSPNPDLPTDATPRTRSVLGGRGNASGFRRTLEAQGLGAHVARRTRTAAPRPRNTPLTSTRSFESRRHKSRGDPRSRTGLRCGQAIVREGAQRPGIKVYIYTCMLCNKCYRGFSLLNSISTFSPAKPDMLPDYVRNPDEIPSIQFYLRRFGAGVTLQ